MSWLLVGSNAAGLVLIATSLWNWGAVEVRGHGEEVFFLTLGGLAWLIAAAFLFSWFGLSGMDDVVERLNPTAALVLVGATVAIALIYSGGSLGEGPSYWNNVFSAGVGIGAFLGLWLLLELASRISVSLAEERDAASGLRCGGYFLGAGIIIARAVAGNWHSESATVYDLFRDGWPAGVLCIVAIFSELILRPRPTRPFPNWKICGLPWALLHLISAVAWVMHLGRWEGMPK